MRLGKLTEDCMGEPVTSVSFTNDGQCTLASSLDHTVRLVDRFSGELLNRLVNKKVQDQSHLD